MLDAFHCWPPKTCYTRGSQRLTFLLQIVYTSIVGVVMLAALLEWFLWIGAFLYCLWKVFRKSEHWTVNVLAVVVAVAFLLLRYVPGP